SRVHRVAHHCGARWATLGSAVTAARYDGKTERAGNESNQSRTDFTLLWNQCALRESEDPKNKNAQGFSPGRSFKDRAARFRAADLAVVFLRLFRCGVALLSGSRRRGSVEL